LPARVCDDHLDDMCRGVPWSGQGFDAHGVAVDGRPAGLVTAADHLRPSAAAAIRRLNELGLEVALISGDNRRTAEAVATELGIERVFAEVHLHGGPAPVPRFLPELIDLIWNRQIEPGKVFDLELSLDETPAGYRAMDQREAINVLLRP
jgi:magnesium-transporting ATPase (P-type)